MLINAALWVIIAGLIVIIPVGCILTRKKSKEPAPTAH